MNNRQENLVVEHAGDFLWITIDRAEKANAMTVAIMEGITAAIRDGVGDSAVRAVLLTAAGAACSAAAPTCASSRRTATWRVSANADRKPLQHCRMP